MAKAKAKKEGACGSCFTRLVAVYFFSFLFYFLFYFLCSFLGEGEGEEGRRRDEWGVRRWSVSRPNRGREGFFALEGEGRVEARSTGIKKVWKVVVWSGDERREG